MNAFRKPLVLLVEDDEVIRAATARSLERDGFAVVTASTGPEGLVEFQRSRPGVAVLDVMLPGLDGVELCREIRRTSQIPVVFLSARTDAIDIVLGLEAGADDYVTKPFDPAVLAARLRAALRRSGTPTDADVDQSSFGSVTIDHRGRQVVRDGEEVRLTPTEYRLLDELARNVGLVLDRSTLLDRVWGYGWAGDGRLVDVHVQRLRAKIEDDPTRPTLVQTVRGVGYKLVRP